VTVADKPTVAVGEEPSGVFRFIVIVAVFLLVGPPVGGAVVWAFVVLNMSLLDYGAPHALPMLFMTVLYAYPLGAPFALAVGIVHAIAAIRLKQNSFLVPLVAAILVTVVGIGLFVAIKPWPGTYGGEVLAGLVLSMPPSLVASFVCWRLTRSVARMA
jgi:hypothetical protein